MVDIASPSPAPAGAPFDAAACARRVMRLARTGSLATTDEAGGPFVSLVTVATSMAGEPILLISRLARHTRNLERDPRAALLVVAPGGQSGGPLAGARLTVTGQVTAPRRDDELARRFLARHPEAAGYVRFGDFGFRRIEPESGHLVAGFGRIVDLAASELMLDLEGCAGLAASEAEALDHVNADHADSVRLYATALCAAPDGVWRMTGLDPEGADLAAESGHVARLDFPVRVSGPGELRRMLRVLAEHARGSAGAS